MEISPSLISFVARAKRRREVLKLLSKERKIQAKIMRETGMYKSHTARTLKELAGKNLIKCLNPKDRAFKFYKVTKKGEDALKEVEKVIQ